MITMFWKRNAEQDKELQNTFQEQENPMQKQDTTSYEEQIKKLESHIHLLTELLEAHDIEIPSKVKDEGDLQIFGSEHYIYNELYLIKRLLFETNKLFIKLFFENKTSRNERT